MTLKLVIGTLAGGIVIFVLAGLFFGVLFAEFFNNSIPREFAGVLRQETDLRLIVISDLLYACMLTFLINGMPTRRTFFRSAALGMIVGFAVTLHFDLIKAATTNMATPASIVANALISCIMSGIGAGVIAAVLGRFESGSLAKST